MPEISFYEQYEWNAQRGAMRFWAVVDGDPMICWIDEEALLSFGDVSEDEELTAQFRFMNHQEEIHACARRLIQEQRFDDDKSVSISARDLEPPAS